MPAAPEVTQSRPAGTDGAPETTPSGILTYLADMRRLAAVESRRAAQRRLGKWQQGGSAQRLGCAERVVLAPLAGAMSAR